MKTTRGGAAGLMQRELKSTRGRQLKAAAVALLLMGVALFSTGCYEDPAYYGHRNVRAGYYSSYAGPEPYYGYEPYGYGYGPGIGVGVSSYRAGYDRPRYYGRRYDRRRYDRRGYDRRGYDRRDGDRRRWDRRGDGRRGDRPRDRRDRRRSRSTEQRMAPAQQQRYAPEGTQPE